MQSAHRFSLEVAMSFPSLIGSFMSAALRSRSRRLGPRLHAGTNPSQSEETMPTKLCMRIMLDKM